MKLDLNYLGPDAKGRQVMDITTPEGMALLGLGKNTLFSTKSFFLLAGYPCVFFL